MYAADGLASSVSVSVTGLTDSRASECEKLFKTRPETHDRHLRVPCGSGGFTRRKGVTIAKLRGLITCAQHSWFTNQYKSTLHSIDKLNIGNSVHSYPCMERDETRPGSGWCMSTSCREKKENSKAVQTPPRPALDSLHFHTHGRVYEKKQAGGAIHTILSSYTFQISNSLVAI